MSGNHQAYTFSAAFRTEDLAVLHCLRALCQWAQVGAKVGSPGIGWGGSSEEEWACSGHASKVRFTSESRRQKWIHKATELLSQRWTLLRVDDNDPATPNPRS